MTHPTDPVAAMREAAKALFLLGTEHGGDPGTFDRDSAAIRASWDRVFEKAWLASPLRRLPLPAAPAPTRPRVSTAGSGQEARLVVTPAAPARPADDARPMVTGGGLIKFVRDETKGGPRG